MAAPTRFRDFVIASGAEQDLAVNDICDRVAEALNLRVDESKAGRWHVYNLAFRLRDRPGRLLPGEMVLAFATVLDADPVYLQRLWAADEADRAQYFDPWLLEEKAREAVPPELRELVEGAYEHVLGLPFFFRDWSHADQERHARETLRIELLSQEVPGWCSAWFCFFRRNSVDFWLAWAGLITETGDTDYPDELERRLAETYALTGKERREDLLRLHAGLEAEYQRLAADDALLLRRLDTLRAVGRGFQHYSPIWEVADHRGDTCLDTLRTAGLPVVTATASTFNLEELDGAEEGKVYSLARDFATMRGELPDPVNPCHYGIWERSTKR